MNEYANLKPPHRRRGTTHHVMTITFMWTYEQGMQGTGEAHHPSRCKSMPAEGHSSGNHGLRHGPRPYRDVKSDIRQVPDSLCPQIRFSSLSRCV